MTTLRTIWREIRPWLWKAANTAGAFIKTGVMDKYAHRKNRGRLTGLLMRAWLQVSPLWWGLVAYGIGLFLGAVILILGPITLAVFVASMHRDGLRGKLE